MAIEEGRSDSATKCGLCGGKAYTPSRFTEDDQAILEGVFNVCGDCEAECTGTGGRSETERFFWTGAREVAQGRAGLEAAQLDAEWAEERRYDY